jgi:uncharacterized membrane protein YkvA (DUF1232 family)
VPTRLTELRCSFNHRDGVAVPAEPVSEDGLGDARAGNENTHRPKPPYPEPESLDLPRAPDPRGGSTLDHNQGRGFCPADRSRLRNRIGPRLDSADRRLGALAAEGGLLREAMRILPDTIRLLRRLATGRSIRKAVRVRLWLLFVYLAIPIDLVPDFVPLLGYADDAIIVAAVLRSVVRRGGPDAVRRNWPGTPEGLATVWRLARLEGSATIDDEHAG